MDYPVESPPFATPTLSGVGGSLKASLEDFRVDEVPAYSPSGTGTHLFVHFEKRDLDTKRAVEAIARGLECDPRSVGWAGLKDRRGITTQWASIEGGDPDKALELRLDGIRMLDAKLHEQKLRTGHLKGNRFQIRLRGVHGDADGAREILSALAETGCPNYFGPQRFGWNGNNLTRARRWIVDGGRAPRKRFEKKLLVSTFQAALFNEVTGRRLEDGLLAEAVAGDLMKKEDSGGLFIAEDLETEGPRVKAWEISPTGPMFGAKMRWPEAEAQIREARVLEGSGLERADLASFRKAGEGTRRALRFRPTDLEVAAEGENLLLAFTLRKGSYATVITREIMKSGESAA
ncbi:MAG: tRNA pseudouridine(13) synthase TruD [Deltaproteobacteria bacterium]|nr:MAG: tRNA pseudouridine(13) synthase TruD [Deltaproteobacteria bacterium]